MHAIQLVLSEGSIIMAKFFVGSVESFRRYDVKVAREGRDKIFTFSFWCIFGANDFFSSKFSGKGVGAMPYLLTNFWSRDSMYDGF